MSKWKKEEERKEDERERSGSVLPSPPQAAEGPLERVVSHLFGETFDNLDEVVAGHLCAWEIGQH